MSTVADSSWAAPTNSVPPGVERSLRELDPLGTIASRPLTIAAAVAAPVIAVTMTMLRWSDIDRIWLMAAALVLLAGACSLLVRTAKTAGSEFTWQKHALVVALAWLATLLSALAQWHGNQFVRDDWGQLILGIVLVATSPYRPIRHLIVAGAMSGAFVAVLALCQSVHLVTPMAPTAFAIIAAVPVLALSFGGAAWAHSAVQTRERRQAARTSTPDDDEKERSVPLGEVERVTLLSGDVAPFLQAILDRGVVSSHDPAAARHIADAVRLIMVAEAKESWLGRVIADISTDGSAGSRTSTFRADAVQDESRLSDTMDFRQHTAVRALLGAMVNHASFDADRFAAKVVMSPAGSREVRIGTVFQLDHTAADARPALWAWLRRWHLRRSVRRSLIPYLAVTRRVFAWQGVITNSSNCSLELTLRFSYGP